MSGLNISISKKEEEMLKLIGRVGFFIINFKDKSGLTKETMYSLVKKELIYKRNGVFIYTKLHTPYCLTDKGIHLVKSRYLINPYRFRKLQAEHDFVLANIYLSLKQDDRERWITETTLGIKYSEESVLDGMYINIKNEVVGVEVITSNYTKLKIKAKQMFIDKHCTKSILIYANKF